MLRQAVRKVPGETVRRPATRVVKAHKTVKKASPATLALATPLFVPRIKLFINNLGAYVAQRKKLFTTNDPVYKRLNTIHSSLVRELKKKNIMTPNMAKEMKKLTPALRGVTKLPANVKGQVGKLAIFIRQQVNKDVLGFIAKSKTLLMPMNNELVKLEKQMLAQIKMTSTSNIQLKVDPALIKRFNALNTTLTCYRTKWFKRLNTISLHGNKQVQGQVKLLKKQIDDMQKCLKRNITIAKRYAKVVKPRKGMKIGKLYTASQMKTLESKMKLIDSTCESFRMKVEHFWDHLKAIKIF